MTNRNYVAGRALEYRRKAHYAEHCDTVLRTAGSHGPFDLIALTEGEPVLLIQCKRVKTEGQATALLREAPPLAPSPHYIQIMDIYVRDTRRTISHRFD